VRPSPHELGRRRKLDTEYGTYLHEMPRNARREGKEKEVSQHTWGGFLGGLIQVLRGEKVLVCDQESPQGGKIDGGKKKTKIK